MGAPAGMRSWALWLAIIGAALFLRLAWLADWPLWLDESWSRWMAERSWAELSAAAARFDTHPPVYYSLLKLWLSGAPATPVSLRLPSILAGMLMVPLAWACARQMRLSPWLVSAFVAFSPALVIASRQARPYALFALAFAAALWAALALARSPRLRLWAAYGLALEATLWLHSLGALFAAALAGALLLALLLERGLRATIVPFLAVHALAGLAWLPAFLTLVEQRRAWTSTWLRFGWDQVPGGLASGLAAPGPGAILIFLLAALGAAFLLRAKESRPAATVLVVTALVPALATILLSIASAPVFLPRTLAPSALPLLLLAAAGVAGLKRPPLRIATGAAALFLLAIGSWVHVSRTPEERWGELSAWLERRVRPGDEIWLLPNELSLPLGYARGGAPLPVPLRQLPADFPAPGHAGPRYSGTAAVPGMTRADADRLVAGAEARGVRGVWLISRFGGLFDPGFQLWRRLGGARQRSTELGFVPLVIQYYRLEPRPIPPPR